MYAQGYGHRLLADATVQQRWPDLPVACLCRQKLINSGSLLTLPCVVVVSQIEGIIMKYSKLLVVAAATLALGGCFSLPAGPAGPQGATGDTGATGYTGARGNTGAPAARAPREVPVPPAARAPREVPVPPAARAPREVPVSYTHLTLPTNREV